jgi:DNA transformation protein
MACSREFVDFVVDQCGRALAVRPRAMFGGYGLYSGDAFFALCDDDRLYLKVDDTTRPAYEAAGMGPFQPPGLGPMRGYHEVPPGVLEDPAALRVWAREAIAVAQRAAARRAPRSAPRAPRGPRS